MRRRSEAWVCVAAAMSACVLLSASCGGGYDAPPPNPPPAADTQAPTVSVTAPAAFATALAGAVALTAAASDNVGVAGVEFELDGVPLGAAVSTPPYSVNVDTTAHASGQHVLRARSADAAGNRSAWAEVTVQFGGTRTQPAGITRNESWGTGLSAATALAQAPDGRIFVAQQGGALHFGVDGKLYAGVGDNANSAQTPDLASSLGKLLRFNDDGSIPTDNPHYNSQTSLARAVWASGLRNPYTFAVHPGTGRIHINDVGEGTWEEIDLGVGGADYGWPASEGPDNISANRTAPLFADYASGFIGALDPANGPAAYAFGSVSGNPVDLLAASDGALLVLTRSAIVRFSKP